MNKNTNRQVILPVMLGIPLPYHQKIFEPFFRVPTGDRYEIAREIRQIDEEILIILLTWKQKPSNCSTNMKTGLLTEKILQQIWAMTPNCNSRNTDVYITKIRSYLKVDTNVEIITLKGVGYYFSC